MTAGAVGVGSEFGRGTPAPLLSTLLSLRALDKTHSPEGGQPLCGFSLWGVAMATVLSDFLGQFYKPCSPIIARMTSGIE